MANDLFTVNPGWTFDEAVDEISARFRPGGLFSGPQRNRLLEAWASMVGRASAVAQLEDAISRSGSRTAFCRSYGFAWKTVDKLRAAFDAAPELENPKRRGLTMFFGTMIVPIERWCVEASIYALLGPDTPCYLAEFRRVGDGAVLQIDGAPLADLEQLGQALWEKYWERDRDAMVKASDLLKTLVRDGPLAEALAKMHSKLEAIELRQPSLSDDATEMLNDKGVAHVREKDLALVRTWGQKATRFALRVAAKKAVGEIDDLVKLRAPTDDGTGE